MKLFILSLIIRSIVSASLHQTSMPMEFCKDPYGKSFFCKQPKKCCFDRVFYCC